MHANNAVLQDLLGIFLNVEFFVMTFFTKTLLYIYKQNIYILLNCCHHLMSVQVAQYTLRQMTTAIIRPGTEGTILCTFVYKERF